MSKAANTVRIFGFYLWVLALTLMLARNLFLSVAGMAPVDDVWIRVVGLLAQQPPEDVGPRHGQVLVQRRIVHQEQSLRHRAVHLLGIERRIKVELGSKSSFDEAGTETDSTAGVKSRSMLDLTEHVDERIPERVDPQAF